MAKKKGRPSGGKKPRGKAERVPITVETLRALPQQPNAWQIEAREMPTRIQGESGLIRPWMVLVVDRTSEMILGHLLTEDRPTIEELKPILAQTMLQPMGGRPHRPTELQVGPGLAVADLQPSIEVLGIRCVAAEELDMIDGILQGIARQLGGEPPGLLDVEGVTPERAGMFYDAVAYFYRQAPWRRLGDEVAIRVDCDRFPDTTRYAIIMGAAGMTAGLTLYENIRTLRKLLTGRLSDEESALLTVATTVLFGEESYIPQAEVEAARRHRWPVAGPEAWPMVFHKGGGMDMAPPEAWELDLLEGCLRALPDFVARRRPGDSTPEEITVSSAGKPIKMQVAWVSESGW